MNSLVSVLSRKNLFVVLDADQTSKKCLFEEIGHYLWPNVGLLIEESLREEAMFEKEIFECLYARERLGSTGLGNGVAIPHGRLKSLQEAVGVFIRLKTPIKFDSPDSQDVRLLFVFLVPEHATDKHLTVLSLVAEVFSSEHNRKLLINAQHEDDIYKIFS
jgi:PTS system nitrogen regulatory IIA component